MASGRFEMRVSEDWIRMVDLARGAEPRGAFVKRLVEGALGGPVAGDAPASARAVPAARVTLGLNTGVVAPPVTHGGPVDRRAALGLPPVRRSPALERFAPDGRA